ncbi:hypothetical protein J6590_076936 [Homalodisca vitripennis]|nr:hypothetical protein J6590_076936 [Homalodisca vitripennis]
MDLRAREKVILSKLVDLQRRSGRINIFCGLKWTGKSPDFNATSWEVKEKRATTVQTEIEKVAGRRQMPLVFDYIILEKPLCSPCMTSRRGLEDRRREHRQGDQTTTKGSYRPHQQQHRTRTGPAARCEEFTRDRRVAVDSKETAY